MESNKRKNSGITLVVLVITMILLLILAGISIAGMGEKNGIINKTKNAKNQNEISQAQEALTIELAKILADSYGNKDLKKLDNMEVNGYITKVSDIARVITLTKNNETYNFIVDSNYNIQNMNNINLNNGENINQNGSSNSDIINDFDIKIEEQTGLNAKINLNGIITTKDNSNILGYIILVNGKNGNMENSLPYTIKLDEINTSYKIDVIAIDCYGKGKYAKTSLKVTTPNMLAEVLDYPRMTSKGMTNVKYTNPDNSNDFFYGLDLSKECTATDALDKAAYDGDDTTYYDGKSSKCKFFFGDDIDIYQVCFKIDRNYSGYIYWGVNWNQSIQTYEGAMLDNYIFHTTYYGKNTKNWQNNLAECKAKVYEIFYDGTIE